MRPRSLRRGILWLALAALAPGMLACGLGGVTTVVVTPTGPAATHTPVPPPPNAITWNQLDGSGNPQIWASINDGAPTQITHAVVGTLAPCGLPFYGAAMFSPDLKHLVVATGGCSVDAQITGALYIVDAATGNATPVPLPNAGGVLTNDRTYGWVNNTTIFAIGDWNNSDEGATYTLGAGAVTPLPGFPGNAREGVVRGNLLWFLEDDEGLVSGYHQDHAYLHRYDLGAHAVLPGDIDLGAWGEFPGSPGDFHWQGWDVSSDGNHVAYQYTTPQQFQDVSGGSGIASETIFYADSGGGGATAIVQYMVTNRLVRLRFSPDGKQIGITEAYGTPDVLSGCVNSPGKKGDPCLQFYSPDAAQYPAWHWDSAYMVTASDQTDSQGGRVLYKDIPGHFTSGVLQPHGNSPWSTPES